MQMIVEVFVYYYSFLLSHSVNIVWSVRQADRTHQRIYLLKNHYVEGCPIVSAFSNSGKLDFIAKQDFLSDHISLACV